MIRINDIRKNDPIVILAFGMSTQGTIVKVNEGTESFVYETDEGETETIQLNAAADNKVPGNVYDVHRQHATKTVVAVFKSWQSGKYYRI